MRGLSFRKDEAVGLDIGSSAIKVVALRQDGAGYAVTAAGIAEIAASEDDNNHQRTHTVRAVRECLESAGVKRKLAVCGVSGPEVAVRDFEFPLLSAEEIAGAVLLEASQVCPFNAADIAVDYQLISDDENKARGVLIAATNKLIKNKVQLAKEAKLKCVLMDVDGLALLNCFNAFGDGHERLHTGRTTAILNVGGSHTSLVIMGGNGWPFIRDMTYAGDDIVEQIATEKDMSRDAVKGILFGDSTAARTELHDSLEKASRKLIANVAETLRYYAAHTTSKHVDSIFVCGGFALAGGFVELLNSRLGAEAVLWNPFDKMRYDGSRQCRQIVPKKGPAMAVAAGLAMRSIRNGTRKASSER